MIPLDLLFDREGLTSYGIPEALRRRYGGDIGFDTPRLYANFVSSLDGVVAIESMQHSSQLISGKSDADRFVMGLLRACADAVLIGAGTLRAAPESLWTPGYIYPRATAEFVELRRTLGRADDPRLVLLTASGDVNPDHPALETGALVLTSEAGARKLRDRLPSSSTVIGSADGGALNWLDVMSTLRSEGYGVVLTEGGPTVIGSLLKAGVIDELFLTLSPILAGRSDVAGRPGLVEGVELLPDRTISGDVLSVRKNGSHLFLRYAITNGDDHHDAAAR